LSSGPSGQASATSSAAPAASADASSFEPYEAGYPPDNNLLELGVFGGVLFPSKKHNLLDERFQRHHYQNSPELGARLGWYPLSWLGLEGEAMAARSKVKADNSRAMLFAGRGQLVVQAPFAYVVPFLTGGVGKLGAIGTSMGTDTDIAWHFGLGAKLALTHAL